MDLALQDHIAVITGASQGIGRAVAGTLAAEGCELHLAARTASDLEQLAASLREQGAKAVHCHALDLALEADQTALAERCGEADILVNCAGDIPGGDLESFDMERWRAGWELKVFGYINLCRLFYPAMKARGRGVIVNIIGAAGARPDAGYIAGSTGNAALIAFTRALGARSVDHGVRVVGVNPSLTDTARGQRILQAKTGGDAEARDHFLAGLPLGRMCEPTEVAASVAFLASPRAAYLSGSMVDVDGGSISRP